MIGLKRVLVPTDFSRASRTALRYGVALARPFKAQLHLLHVPELPGTDGVHPFGLFETMRRATHERLRAQLTERERRELKPERAVRLGAPADEIVDYASERDIDLIVMGTHGRQGVARMLVGSVAEKVVRRAPCSVLSVRHPEHEFLTPGEAGADDRAAQDSAGATAEVAMITLKNILVATDFSEPSEAAVTYGRELATRFGAALHVLHAAENILGRFGAETYSATAPELQGRLEADARRRLNELLIDSDNSGPSTIPVLLTASSPALAIVDYAKEKNIDLIVVGTHGRSGLAHLVVGSVAERVVRLAPCPVLTVRHPEREFVQPDTLAAAVHA
jgi:nucleotide-binding universal stress UspA family protein